LLPSGKENEYAFTKSKVISSGKKSTALIQ